MATKSQHPLGLKCASCLHHSHGPKASGKDDLCSNIGILGYSVAPAHCYTPNPYLLLNVQQENLLLLGRHIKDFTQETMMVLAETFMNMSSLLKLGFKFGQPVYVCLGEDYLSHYFKGYVIGATQQGSLLISSTLTNDTSAMLTMMPESVLSGTEFEEHKQYLLRKKRLSMEGENKFLNTRRLPLGEILNRDDRDDLLKPTVRTKVIEYVPPTLDSAPSEWFDSIFEKEAKRDKQPPKVIALGKKKNTVKHIDTVQEADGTVTKKVRVVTTAETVVETTVVKTLGSTAKKKSGFGGK